MVHPCPTHVQSPITEQFSIDDVYFEVPAAARPDEIGNVAKHIGMAEVSR